MNDKEWGDEIWDNEPDDDDDFNDLGSDVDANNDETFDNAAEWNEDEHEEMIARDSILSHSSRNNNHFQSSRSSNNNNNRLDNSNNNSIGSNNNSNNHCTSDAYFSNVVGSSGRGGWNSIGEPDPFPVLSSQSSQHQSQSTSATWQAVQNTTDRLHQLQVQQQHLLMQQRLQNQEQQHKQQLRDRQILQQERDQQRLSQQFKVHVQAESPRQVLRVDELERQLLKTRITQDPNPMQKNIPQAAKRTGWSPFGGKDLFTNPESPTQSQLNAMGQSVLINTQPSQSLTLEQQHQLLIQQNMSQQQQLAILKQQQIQQEQRLMSQNPQCFTVEELERKMIAERTNKSNNSPGQAFCFLTTQVRLNDKPSTPHNTHQRRDGDSHDRHDRHDRHERHDWHERDSRDRRDRKEYHRNLRDGKDNRDNKREPDPKRSVIIPPQVQLSVIDKAKRLHSITAMHPDEFLQDRMPTSKGGFPFKRHSKSSDDRVEHDGVLTEKERNWLTKIQEKIQADYDDNLDQDYYYLLYFNRISMADEAAQKPCGPGVLDRRFIPRERLLYNSST